jgi:extradiol dioxygenase family protein
VPGGRVDIMGARGDAPRGSRGAAIDHIGFEVADMSAFAARAESLGIAFDREPQRVESIGLAIAFLTDPVGTYVEVTEGLGDLD